MTFTFLSKNLVNQFTLTHGFIHVQADRQTECPNLVLTLTRDVKPGIFFNRLGHLHALERTLEIHLVLPKRSFSCPVHSHSGRLNHSLRAIHHPQIILVRHVHLHTSKFRVMRPVHTLVTEITGELEHPVKTTHDQTFQVQLIRDTQIERYIQCVMMRDKRTGRSSSRYSLQHRSLHLQTSHFRVELTDGIDHLRTLDKHILYLRIHD